MNYELHLEITFEFLKWGIDGSHTWETIPVVGKGGVRGVSKHCCSAAWGGVKIVKVCGAVPLGDNWKN